MKSRGTFLQSCMIAIRGIIEATRQERNLRIHWGIAVLVILLSFVLQITSVEWALIVLCIGAVTSAETLNSAIEETVDLASPETHETARKAKDFASGAVLLISIAVAVVGLIILGPKLLNFLTL